MYFQISNTEQLFRHPLNLHKWCFLLVRFEKRLKQLLLQCVVRNLFPSFPLYIWHAELKMNCSKVLQLLIIRHINFGRLRNVWFKKTVTIHSSDTVLWIVTFFLNQTLEKFCNNPYLITDGASHVILFSVKYSKQESVKIFMHIFRTW